MDPIGAGPSAAIFLCKRPTQGQSNPAADQNYGSYEAAISGTLRLYHYLGMSNHICRVRGLP